MAPHKWHCLVKDKNISKFRELPRFEVTKHPLHSTIDMVTVSRNSKQEVDPLTSALEGADPLSAFVQESLLNESLKPTTEADEKFIDENGVKAWNSRKHSILNKYTTLEKLSIISSYLPGGEKLLVKQQSNVSEQMKHRLEQLDQFEEGSVRKTMGLTQQEYAARISLLNHELVQAWNSEQRVKALKIAIQCSKLLVDTSVMQFYPSKFILITDILDTFGNLVYDRLKVKSYENSQTPKYLSEVDPNMVPESAKETCQNWLYKMSSIRELIPRLYIEMSLLRCYIFLSTNEFDSAISRITKMIRGVGNPLVAIYARCYLCRVALNVLTKNRDYFKENLKEFLETYSQIFEWSLKKDYELQSLNMDMYLSLYTPALDWLFHGITTYGVSTDVFLDQLLTKCDEINNKELLLYSVISTFDSFKITNNASKILELIASCESVVMKQEMLHQLGCHLCEMSVCSASTSETLMQTSWKLIMTLSTLKHMLRAAEPWLQFASAHLSAKHVNILLRGILKYISKTKDPIEDCASSLHIIIKRMMNSIEDVEEMFLMDGFMPLFDVVQTGPNQLDMSKMILNIFFTRRASVTMNDHILIGNLMRLCRILHDSVNALTVEDEQKLIADLISKFVYSVNFHDDLEEQLTFYVDCRAAFINLDSVLVTLVHCVNRLSAHSDEGSTGARLARACAAYSFITVASLPCALAKAQLYLLTGQAALVNACYGQAEACMKVSISLIPDIPAKVIEDGQMKSTQLKIHALISNFLSTLLVVPDNVETNCKLYLLKGILKAVEMLPWEKTDSQYYSILLMTLDLLCNMAQETYTYHVESVVSNDLLYGSDEEFLTEIEILSTSISEQLLSILKQLANEKCFKKQFHLSMELFWRVARRGDLKITQMESLAANLWYLAKRNQDCDIELMKRLISVIIKENEKSSVYNGLLARLN